MSAAPRPPWDFGYAPATRHPFVFGAVPGSLALATTASVSPAQLVAALTPRFPDATVVAVFDRAPLHWFELKLSGEVRVAEVEACLRAAGLPVRYVVSTRLPDARVFPLATSAASPCRPNDWRPPTARTLTAPEGPGAYFLDDGPGGLRIDRAHVGAGRGTRLAVIDNDAAESELLGLDAEVRVRVERSPHAHFHGALMVAWAVGAAATGFAGVAPEASARLYLVPKAGDDLLALPLAVVRAAEDGADVILCPTYVEGATSPLWSDAIAFATALGRGGRGAAVVLPTGRDASSPEGSVRASWTVAWGSPAADPRVFCVGPSGRGGGWFLWRDADRKLRPFANRGPSVRWLAPGDDLAMPFGPAGRTVHAESSGASALAAGVLLLVFARSPAVSLAAVARVLDRTARPVPPPTEEERTQLASASDLLPVGRDADGHDPKQGYGRLDARRACLMLHDPLSFALISMGEEAVAARVATAVDALGEAWSELACWLAACCAEKPELAHGVTALARHLRLVVDAPSRVDAHGVGALARQLVLLAHLAVGLATVEGRPWAERLLAAVAPLDDAMAHGEATTRAMEREVTAWFRGVWAPAPRDPP